MKQPAIVLKRFIQLFMLYFYTKVFIMPATEKLDNIVSLYV